MELVLRIGGDPCEEQGTKEIVVNMTAILGRLKGRMFQRKGGRAVSRSSDDLLNAVALSEKDYLEFGNDLQSFYDRAKEILETASSLAGMAANEQLNELMKRLHEASEKMKRTGASSIQETQALTPILEKAGKIESSLHPFENVVRTLQVLCNIIRIESVGLGTEKIGFDALSDDVHKLAGTIHEKSSTMIESSRSLTGLVRENLSRVMDFEQRQNEKGKLIVETLMNRLRALSERQENFSIRLKSIRRTWEEITRDIGETVSSMQFHDITRQRIEHVVEALGKAFDGPSPGYEGKRRFPSGKSPGRLMGNIHRESRIIKVLENYDGLRLQKAQLLHTREELVSATGGIGARLQNLAMRIGKMSLGAGEETRDARGAKTSFFAEMEESIVSLTQAITEYEEVCRKIASALEGFTMVVSRMDGFLKDIVTIGIEMNLIAVNAAVHACHVGEGGLPLGVLAERIHTLAQETSKIIESIGEDLHSMSGHALGLKRFGDSESGRRAGESLQMVESLREMIPYLKSLDSESGLCASSLN